MSRSAQKLRLVTIRFSHYNEKARWALDYHKVPYSEEPHLPMFSRLALWRAGEWLCDSSLISQWVDEKFGENTRTLYPREVRQEIEELEQRFHDKLGPMTRRVAYWEGFNSPAAGDVLSSNVAGLEGTLGRYGVPLLKNYILGGLNITKEKAERSRGYIRAEFEEVNRMLADGREFLVGGQFTAADISFACMAAPALLPSPEEGFGGRLISPKDVDQSFQDYIAELRATPAGQFALRMFKEHRGQPVVPCLPALL